MKHFSFIVFLSLVLCGAYAFASDKAQQEIRAYDIFKNLKCMTCAGQSVMDSESEFAKSLRSFVNEEISAGKNNEEIYDSLRSRYGDEIFFNPPINSFTILLWILPFFLIFSGFMAVVIMLRKKTAKQA